MAHLGIDLEQFVTDPYGSGIQRVLQQLALNWPQDRLPASFIVPWGHEYLVLEPNQAAELVSIAFTDLPVGTLRDLVCKHVDRLADSVPAVPAGQLLALFSAWLLPEVSYLPSVLRRFEIFQAAMPSVMIGYDILPMTEPGNYRFTPGQSAWVSEYFRLLARADSVICISAFSRESILHSLRRDRTLPISVAHPGGDHVQDDADDVTPAQKSGPVRMLRIGTLESRKRPVEIARAFAEVVRGGEQLELTFIGSSSASDDQINSEIRELSNQGIGLTWISQADDALIQDHLSSADAFLSIGTEGYGIPVLEAIGHGTPVLFDGVQPAAELMIGYGAQHIQGLTHDDLVASFRHYLNREHIVVLTRQIDSDAIPSWAEFSDRVCSGVLSVT